MNDSHSPPQKTSVHFALIVALLVIASGIFSLFSSKHSRSPSRLKPSVHTPDARLVHDEKLNLNIWIPSDFEKYAGPKKTEKVACAFMKTASNGGSNSSQLISITALGGLISPDVELNRKRLRESMPSNIRLTTNSWRGLTIDVCVTEQELNGMETTVYQMRIPLKPTAIDLSVYGIGSGCKTLQELADSLLASLEGETNW